METVNNTESQFFVIVERCRTLFFKKNEDYGPSWTIFRPSSLSDQIFIKARRIRSIQETGVNKVGDSIESEFIGIINYSVVGLLLLDLQGGKIIEKNVQDSKKLEQFYDEKVQDIFKLLQKKNHDYGEAWRDLRIPSMTDLILAKLMRLRQIEENKGVVKASEGPHASYHDIFNYAIFCLILMGE